MARGNTVLLNISGGEIAPEMYARLDLPVYQRGNQRVQNYFVLPQGGLRFRNGSKHVHNTRQRKTGRLIPFAFNESDTYVLEFTDQKLRFYRNFGAILNPSKTITAITKANPAVITSNAHGFNNDDEVYITGVVGMTEVNDQFFIVKNKTANTFELANIYGTLINSTNFQTYSSGGSAATPYEIASPYLEAHIPEFHYWQSADTIYITHQKYYPFKLTRTAHTSWTISGSTDRTNDPFEQRHISNITKANPGVFTTSSNHQFNVDDEVYINEVGGMVEVNNQRYFVRSTPTGSTFTLKDGNGVQLDTSGFTAYTSGGEIIRTKKCPKTVAFLGDARLVYANTQENPAGLWFSRAPNSTTGATRFDDFTTGSNATDGVQYTLATVFNKQDAVQWLSTLGKSMIAGCASSTRRIHGDTIDDPISPSSINATPINNIGAAPIQSYSSGQTMFYIDAIKNRLQSFLFAQQSNDFATVNQHLVASQLGSSNFKEIAQQRGDSGLLWILRDDGVLTGLTFNELESIFGWHRHYFGGNASIDSVSYNRAKVVSIAVEPRSGEEFVLWLLVERTVSANTYRSVEYLTRPIRFVEPEDFFSDTGSDAQASDTDKYINATYEQLKDSIHLDCSLSYDGSALSTTISITPSAVSGSAITLTASAGFFTSAMVGKEVWKKYDIRGNGGGRAKITGFTNSTTVTAEVLVPFNNTSAIPAGSWLLTTNKVYGLLHMVGETLSLQADGAPAGQAVIASDGSISLDSQASKIHVGQRYTGLSLTLNLDVAGERGSAQAKIRKILEIAPRFHNTVGAKVGTSVWNAESIVFKTMDDLTDRPTPLFRGVQFIRPSSSWARGVAQVALLQDVPSPQTVLSLDVMVETSDP